MQFQDALRAQYFIRSLENKIEEITPVFSGDLSSFLTRLCHQLDQILLPVIAGEIAQAKDEGFLIGYTPEDRYQSFFIQEGQFTNRAKDLPQKYPFLMSQIDQTIDDAFANLKKALYRAQKETIFKDITTVDLITGSDKHRRQQALLFIFSDNTAWVYKPRDLLPEVLLSRFVAHLKLDPPYELRSPSILARKGYGWMEFQPHLACQSKQEIHEYFQRAGVLIAIADSLNFSDGHYENIIASGPYPVLIDGETLFQNYNDEALKEKSIFSTGLLQKVKPNQKRKSYYSAFQANQKETYQVLYPHVLKDRTDCLEVEFHGAQQRSFNSLPHLADTHFLAQDFGAELMDGLQYGYEKIHKHSQDILSDEGWWKTLSSSESRILLHHTVNYAFLLRRIQQPDACKSKETAITLIKEKLGDTIFSPYETRDLLAGNIPYFYHHPNSPSIYNGDGEPYPPYLPETSIDQIKRNLQENPNKKIQEALRLVKFHLGIKNHETSPAA